jgi:fatty acid desaturase
MSVDSVASGFMGVGCVIFGFLAMIFVASGAWIGIPLLFFLGLIMIFVIAAIFSTIEWVMKQFRYDPDKKTAEQEEADRMMAEIRVDVARRKHAQLLYESEMRAQTEALDPHDL